MKSVAGHCLCIWVRLRSLLVNRAKNSTEDNCECRIGESVVNVGSLSLRLAASVYHSLQPQQPAEMMAIASFLPSKACTYSSFSWLHREVYREASIGSIFLVKSSLHS